MVKASKWNSLNSWVDKTTHLKQKNILEAAAAVQSSVPQNSQEIPFPVASSPFVVFVLSILWDLSSNRHAGRVGKWPQVNFLDVDQLQVSPLALWTTSFFSSWSELFNVGFQNISSFFIFPPHSSQKEWSFSCSFKPSSQLVATRFSLRTSALVILDLDFRTYNYMLVTWKFRTFSKVGSF